ncbi:hypothetical protein KIPB_013898, partial [Kipferlia bialata]|eukprot:g13898.t1
MTDLPLPQRRHYPAAFLCPEASSRVQISINVALLLVCNALSEYHNREWLGHALAVIRAAFTRDGCPDMPETPIRQRKYYPAAFLCGSAPVGVQIT